ncbi:MAG TPA: hypothetical protein VGF08_10725 [Terriglobales bacterium]
MPFDRQPRAEGISPSQSIIPSISKLPVGTPITIRLQVPISSAWAHAGDRFKAILDDPVVIEGQTVIARGSAVSGHILAARPSSMPDSPGYIRLALSTLNFEGKALPVETSSVFAKAGSHTSRRAAKASEQAGSAFLGDSGTGSLLGTATNSGSNSPAGDNAPMDISLNSDRRLTFRIAQPVDLQ